MCVGILEKLGVDRPTLTKVSVDEGIDFFGKLRLEKLLVPDGTAPSLERQLGVWIVGQAKHYKSSKVSTFDVRDLVGAVELAKGRAYSSGESTYPDLAMRVCDPVFYVFITTGRLSSATWRLLRRSGVIGMDGQMVAAFLAAQGIGMRHGALRRTSLNRWLKKYL
jgi:restriction endonuclease Mrr